MLRARISSRHIGDYRSPIPHFRNLRFRDIFAQGGTVMTARIGPRLTLKALTVATAVVTAVALAPSLPAQALGNNRDVSRGCGTNHVASGRYSGTSAWAQTTKVSGDCAGRLSAGLRASDGYTWPRVYGTSTSAYTSRTDSAGFGTGLHWGCDACNVTTS